MFPCTVLSRVLLFPASTRQSTYLPPPLSVSLSFSLDSLLTSSASLYLSGSAYLSFSRFPIYFFLLFRHPHALHPRDRTPHIRLSFFFELPPPPSSLSLSLPLVDPPSVRGTNRRVPRDTLVSRALAGEKSRNDVTLLGRNRESRVNPGRRDHPVRQEPRVFLDTRADRGFRAKSAHQGRRARPGRSGPSARRARQDLQVPR